MSHSNHIANLSGFHFPLTMDFTPYCVEFSYFVSTAEIFVFIMHAFLQMSCHILYIHSTFSFSFYANNRNEFFSFISCIFPLTADVFRRIMWPIAGCTKEVDTIYAPCSCLHDAGKSFRKGIRKDEKENSCSAACSGNGSVSGSLRKQRLRRHHCRHHRSFRQRFCHH